MMYVINFVLQAIECLICFSFYEGITSYRKHVINRGVILFAGYIMMYIVNLAFNYNIIINSLVMIASHFLFSKFLYKQKVSVSLFYATFITILVTITEFGAANIIAFIFHTEAKDFTQNVLNYIILIILSKSFLFIFLWITGNIINKIKGTEKVNLVFLIYPFSLLIVITIIIVISDGNNLTEWQRAFLSVSILALTASILFTCVFKQVSSKREAELIELKALQQRQELDNTYFELLENQNEELQIFVHDIKNHLSNIYSLSDDSEKTRCYIEGIVSDIDSANQIGKTNNNLLDLIIKKYNFICQKNGISFEKNIHSSEVDFISDSDLTAIFNNLLDNAVEAAKASTRKYIVLNINNFGNITHIDLLNSCDETPIAKNHRLVTNKKDRIIHGFGYKSVTRTVKKYNGDIEWQYDKEKKEFSVSIIF